MAKKEEVMSGEPVNPAQPEQPGFKNDQYWGKGGRFVVDPKTGKRVPAHKYRAGQTNGKDAKEIVDNG